MVGRTPILAAVLAGSAAVAVALAATVPPALGLTADGAPPAVFMLAFAVVWTGTSTLGSSIVWRRVAAASPAEPATDARFFPAYSLEVAGRSVTVRHAPNVSWSPGGGEGAGKALNGVRCSFVAPVEGVEDAMRIDVEDPGLAGLWGSDDSEVTTGTAAFDDRFLVECIDADRARAVLAPDLREALLELREPVNVTIMHRTVVIRYDYAGFVGFTDPALIEQYAETAARLAAAVEAAADQ